MCMVQPMGSTRSLTSLGTPMASQASLFTGRVAAELWVAKAVTAGVKMYFSIRLRAGFPPAKRAYRGKKITTYSRHRG